MTSHDTDPLPPTPQARSGERRREGALQSRQAHLGERFGHIGPAERIAFGLSAVWLLLVLAFWLFLPAPNAGSTGTGAGSLISAMVAAILPVVLIWVVAITARNIQQLRQEAQQMRATLDMLRVNMVPPPVPQPARADPRPAAPAEPRVFSAQSAAAPDRQGIFTSRRDGVATEPSADGRAALIPARPAPAAEEEPVLALGTPPEALAPPLANADFIRALNFPDNAEDREGFRVLRRALEDRSTAKLIRAAQDILNLLSQIDIYMDDLAPDLARPELWRRFAMGERGREVASVGGIRDRSSLALGAAQMRSDAVFRDAAHHFLRQFDRSFQTFEQGASDQEIVALANTRTARAFMLMGRVTGIFD
ncbi:MAG TPA: hypothetical protein VGC40_11350 [Paenirhodobacter sp.]